VTPVARTEDILIETLENELIVYDRPAKRAHRLNPTSAFLWRNCDGTRTVADLAKLVHNEMGLPEDENLVSLALELLEEQQLLKTSLSSHGVSRRDVMHRLKALGVAAAMLPIVATIAIPPPAAAASRSTSPAETPSSTPRDTPTSTSRWYPFSSTDKTGAPGNRGRNGSGPGRDRLGSWYP
jgi:Coenzyme PQQ synthesis protein D (PqqD)